MTNNTLLNLRLKKPLILFLTNSVTENFCANVLLALGASPMMSHAKEEYQELINLADGLVINLGTLSKNFLDSVHIAIRFANQKGMPIVFDPVGAGASQFRIESAKKIIKLSQHLILKCNPSELIALANGGGHIKGVDSCHFVWESLPFAKYYIKQEASIAAILLTGQQDVLLSEKSIEKNNHGHVLMSQVTGMGCALSGCLAAAYVSNAHSQEALIDITKHYTLAGQLAGAYSQGPGSFMMNFLDELAK